MIRVTQNLLRRFTKAEDGQIVVEFAIMFPIFLTILIGSVELGIMTLRSAMLERALDISVREVRLSTGHPLSYVELKQSICDNFQQLDNCQTALTLEMIQVDPRNWDFDDQGAICSDRSEEIEPVTAFVAGLDNELMILRACVKYAPMFPTTGLAPSLTTDSAGDISLVAKSAFVQEPR
jgi:hypothetical protein